MKLKEIKNCINCGDEIKGRGTKFCNQSCNAIYQNKSRIKKIEKKCLCCETLTKNKKYCSSQCVQDHRRELVFERIESGDTGLDFRQYKYYLIYKYGEKCMECGWCEINKHSGKIPIELEHVDGDSSNNSLNNLKLLCPNCHSLTPTFRNLNKGNGRDERMIKYYERKIHREIKEVLDSEFKGVVFKSILFDDIKEIIIEEVFNLEKERGSKLPSEVRLGLILTAVNNLKENEEFLKLIKE